MCIHLQNVVETNVQRQCIAHIKEDVDAKDDPRVHEFVILMEVHRFLDLPVRVEGQPVSHAQE